jgi:hypothetical protein
MASLDQAALEKRPDDFDLAALMAARDKTLGAVAKISAEIHPGMLEDDAYRRALKILEEMGAEKHWHRPWIRFGENTLKHYGLPSAAGTRLGENDIFFIDIGPVWQGYEGDAGNTYVVGNDADMKRAGEDARRLFDETRECWRRDGLAGPALYHWAEARARDLGWELNLAACGHRVSEFPHALHFKGGMKDVDFQPSPHAWILEIQLRHPRRPFGAFYEDLLF